MRILFIAISLMAVTLPVQAQGRFRPVQCVRNSIVPADLHLTYGTSGVSNTLVLDEDIQIQKLLAEFTEQQPTAPITDQVFKIEFDFIDDPTRDWDRCVTSRYNYMINCLGNGQIRFIGTSGQELGRFNAGLNITSEFSAHEILFSNGEISRNEQVTARLQFNAIDFQLSASPIDLEFDASNCRYP